MEGENYLQESGDRSSRKTLDPNKFYLDSCASTFIKQILKNIGDAMYYYKDTEM